MLCSAPHCYSPHCSPAWPAPRRLSNYELFNNSHTGPLTRCRSRAFNSNSPIYTAAARAALFDAAAVAPPPVFPLPLTTPPGYYHQR